MDRALYLRPESITDTGFDACVKEWLLKNSIEPVNAGEHELVVYLPYDGGGCYYHQKVSPRMAAAIVSAIARDVEVRGIKVSDTETVRFFDYDAKRYRDVLAKVELVWCDANYRTDATLGIMSPDETLKMETEIRETSQISSHDIGWGWRPVDGRS